MYLALIAGNDKVRKEREEQMQDIMRTKPPGFLSDVLIIRKKFVGFPKGNPGGFGYNVTFSFKPVYLTVFRLIPFSNRVKSPNREKLFFARVTAV
jgi:hypothetical protein